MSNADNTTNQPSSKRYFELVDEKSNKFWEIFVVGDQLTTRWGKIDTQGQSKTKTLESPAAATVEQEKQIDKKLAKGYQEIATTDQNSNAETEPQIPPSQPLEEETSQVSSLIEQAANLDNETDKETFLPELIERMQQFCSNLNNLQQSTPTELVQTLSGEMPVRINLQVVPGGAPDVNVTTQQWTQFLQKNDFELINDFTIAQLPFLIRGFVREPDLAAAICCHEDFTWIDIVAPYSDGTLEVWSNVPAHDETVPPWCSLHWYPNSDIESLFDHLINQRSENDPRRLRSHSFVHLYENSYQEDISWRVSIFEASQPTSPKWQTVEAQVWAFASEYDARKYYLDHKPEKTFAAATIFKVKPPEQLEILKACYRLYDRVIDKLGYDVTAELRNKLLRKKLPFSNEDLEFLAEELKKTATCSYGIDDKLLGAFEQIIKRQTLSQQTQDTLRNARDSLRMARYDNPEKIKSRIDALVGDHDDRIPIRPGEPWADALIHDLQQMPDPRRRAWTKFLHHCLTASASKPSSKWLKTVTPLLSEVTQTSLLEHLSRWLPLLDQPNPHSRQNPLHIKESHQDLLRGLIWCASLEQNESITPIIGAAAITAFKKIPTVGARSVRFGNACINALADLAESGGITQLAILKIKVKHIPAQKLIDKKLSEAAERLGIPREEIEELSVPTFGLEDVGKLTETLGDFRAELTVGADNTTKLRWFKADGKIQKSVPAAVKGKSADELKQLKTAEKELKKMLPVLRERLERIYLEQRTWPLDTWRERYLDHPLVGTLSRRLIWQFETNGKKTSAIFSHDQLVDSDDQPLELDKNTIVRLWHPIEQSIETVVAWRNWLIKHEVRQPFKQAHREVYLLTDAERDTEIYSNRFAAHILKQSQFRALARTRSWTSEFIGPWDGGDLGISKRELNAWNLRTEFWVTPAIEEEFNDAAGYFYVSTDQVRFYESQAGNADPLQLADIPSLVFTEIMRDVDLFVGVASVGNDPNWIDGGPVIIQRDYWESYSFGELSLSAEIRKEVLQQLVPKLSIADRCSFTDRFLVVRGDIKTYKIHFRSGNILMEPNDRYLCIVPSNSASSSQKVYLPFEGDRMLSLILSKAFMLADDTNIKDRSIKSQIGSS